MSVDAAPRPVEEATQPSRPGSSDRMAYLTIRSAEWLGMRLPRRTGLALAHLYFRAHYARAEGQRRVVARNLGHVLGLDQDMFFLPDYASINTVRIEDGEPQVRFLNDVRHVTEPALFVRRPDQ